MINTSYIIDDRKLFIYEMALRDAMASATRRNRLYKKGITNEEYRKAYNEVYDLWPSLLYDAANEYIEHEGMINVDFIVRQMINIKNKMSHIENTIFKLSHAQKSLSVFLKYLWCYGVIVEPPICPIDAKVLEVAKQQDSSLKKKIDIWTNLDDAIIYKDILYSLNKYANSKNKTIVKWELIEFNNNKDKEL